jgi:membrane protease YdiL (CAAX protease family)
MKVYLKVIRKNLIIEILFLLAGLLSFLFLAKTFKFYLNKYIEDVLISQFASNIIIKTVVVIILVLLITRVYKFSEFNGLTNIRFPKNIQSVFIALLFVGFGLINNWEVLTTSSLFLLTLFALSCFTVGFLEELFFRGILFPLLIKRLLSTNWGIYLAALISSIIFGVSHYLNAFEATSDIAEINAQVILAICLGVFLCGLLIRTSTIFVPAIIHSLINFSFSLGKLKNNKIDDIASDYSNDWTSIFIVLLLYALIVLGGLYMIKKTPQEKILSKLISN